MRKIILTIILFCGFVFTSCESEQVKMGRRAVYDKINSGLSSGEIEGESHYIIENGNVYWEVEYHHWSGHPGTQIAFMHFMSNGNYAVDITKQEFEKQTGKKAKKGK